MARILWFGFASVSWVIIAPLLCPRPADAKGVLTSEADGNRALDWVRGGGFPLCALRFVRSSRPLDRRADPRDDERDRLRPARDRARFLRMVRARLARR